MSDAEAAAGDRVRGEVVAVVYDAHLRQLRKTEQWCVRAARAAQALPRQRRPLQRRVLLSQALRRCLRAANRPAGFDKAAAVEEGAGGAGGAGDAGCDDAERARRDEREPGGSESSDDGLPPLEANMNRHRAGGGGHRVAQEDSDADSD